MDLNNIISTKTLLLITMLCQISISSVSVAATAIEQCDELAAHPNDPEKITSGISFDEINVSAAQKACKAALSISPDNIRIQYQYARVLEKQKNYQDAFKWYMKSAEKRYAQSQLRVGVMYNLGLGVNKDLNSAFKWYKKAAESGHHEAYRILGALYYKGDGVEKDNKKAVKWLIKGAELGDIKSQSLLSDIYAQDENFKAAFIWAKKGAEQGDAYSQYSLASMYDSGEGVTESKAEAFNWYQKAAEQGYVYAQFVLGTRYEHGNGVNKDLNKALIWYKKAADQGNEDALEGYNFVRTSLSAVGKNELIVGAWDCLSKNYNGESSTKKFRFESDSTFELLENSGAVRGDYEPLSDGNYKLSVKYVEAMIKSGLSPNVEARKMWMELDVETLTFNQLKVTATSNVGKPILYSCSKS